jgi:hypothetical protein
LEDAVLMLLGRNPGYNHYIYQENFYNGAEIGQNIAREKRKSFGVYAGYHSNNDIIFQVW